MPVKKNTNRVLLIGYVFSMWTVQFTISDYYFYCYCYWFHGIIILIINHNYHYYRYKNKLYLTQSRKVWKVQWLFSSLFFPLLNQFWIEIVPLRTFIDTTFLIKFSHVTDPSICMKNITFIEPYRTLTRPFA